MGKHEISAVVLAGGLSSRMKEFKPLLDVGGKPLILRTLETFKSTGVKDVVVVLGHGAESLSPVLSAAGVRSVKNPHFKLGMFSSIQVGAAALESSADAFFILPADIPFIRPTTIRRLEDAYRRGSASVIYPVFDNRRGHPPLLAAACARDILNEGPLSNLREVLARRERESVDVECPDAAIHADFDTPEDCAGFSRFLLRRDIPAPAECVSLMRLYGASDAVIRHGQAVASLAKRIGESLILRRRASLNLDLLVAVGILHDIAKGVPAHPLVGAAIMRKEGFPKLADCIASHMDLSLPEGESWLMTEKEILFLADKMVEEDKIVSLENRFEKSERKAGGEIRIVAKVRERRDVARALMARVESCMKNSDREAVPWLAQA